MAVVTPTDCHKSARNCCVIEAFGGGFVLSRCFFSVRVGGVQSGSPIAQFNRAPV